MTIINTRWSGFNLLSYLQMLIEWGLLVYFCLVDSCMYLWNDFLAKIYLTNKNTFCRLNIYSVDDNEFNVLIFRQVSNNYLRLIYLLTVFRNTKSVVWVTSRTTNRSNDLTQHSVVVKSYCDSASIANKTFSFRCGCFFLLIYGIRFYIFD